MKYMKRLTELLDDSNALTDRVHEGWRASLEREKHLLRFAFACLAGGLVAGAWLVIIFINS